MRSRAWPSRVSGGASKSAASTSTTSAIESTSRLTASPCSRTTMTTASVPAGRGGRPRRSRSSIAVTTWPRRLISPATAVGASGTRVSCWLRSTSCTCSTSMPYRSPSSRKVASCPLVAGAWEGAVTSDLQRRGGGALRRRGGVARVESRVGGEDRGTDVEQLGHLVAEDGGAEQAQVVDVAADGGLAVDDVEDLLHDDGDAAAVVAVDDDLEDLAVGLAVGAEVPVEPDHRQDRAAVLHDLPVAHLLHRLGTHLLEAGDRVERDGHAPPAADGRQQHPLPVGLAGRGGVRSGLLRVLPLVGLGAQGAAGQRLDVEDQGDCAVTEDGGARVEADRLHLATDGLDDDLLGVDDPVHDQAETPALGPQHRDDHVAVVPFGGQAQHVGEPDEGEQLAPEPVDLRAADLLDRVGGLLGVEGDELLQADLRDGVAVAGALDGQRRDDREGQRDAQPADGAHARVGLDLDGAAARLDVGLD